MRGSGPEDGLPEERPQRTLYLSTFEIDQFPVRFGDFAEFVEAGGYRTEGFWSREGWAFCQREGLERPRFSDEPQWAHVSGPSQPVCGVSFWEAEAYARYSGGRLPTEAEWEKAARGSDGRTYPWGDLWEPGRSSFRGGPTRAAPPVGSFPSGASPCGALDLAGGVWEWCQDWYDPGYYARAPLQDPKGPESGQLKVARGGSWNAMPLQSRAANRNAWKPSARFSNLGFRCARSV